MGPIVSIKGLTWRDLSGRNRSWWLFLLQFEIVRLWVLRFSHVGRNFVRNDLRRIKTRNVEVTREGTRVGENGETRVSGMDLKVAEKKNKMGKKGTAIFFPLLLFTSQTNYFNFFFFTIHSLYSQNTFLTF